MTKQCKNVLNELRKISDSTDTELCFIDGDTHICADLNETRYYDYSKYEGEIQSIIDWLSKDGYIKYAINEYYFTLTHKGLHPYAVKWDALKQFLFRSILVPIGVSVVTTAILYTAEHIL